MYKNSSNITAVNSIYKTTKLALAKTNPKFTEEELKFKTEELLKIHGMNKDKFDIVSTIETFFEEKLNDVSIDDNSNKNETTIKGVLKEASAPFDKLVGYRYLYRKMKELYGKKEAKHLSGLMYTFDLGLSDATNILSNYCYAIDASKLVEEGRPFGQLPSAPCKRISSYISSLCETVHQMSNHLAGAIAIGSFFMDLAHLCIMNEKIPLCNITRNGSKRKYIENEMQQFIHSVNHLSRNAMESPFTNVSIFDRPKLEVLLEDYKWYFMDVEGTTYYNPINYILELQEIYLDLFDEGDPLNAGIPYRFPVTTVNFSKKDGELVDMDHIKNFLSKYDIYRYNIFTSEGTKIASCCFKGTDWCRFWKDADTSVISSFEDMYLRNEGKTVLVRNDAGELVKAKPVEVPYRNPWVRITIKGNNTQINATDNHIHFVVDPENNTKDGLIEMRTSDQLEVGMHLLGAGLTSQEISAIEERPNSEGFAYCFEIEDVDENEQPNFELPFGIITHNCRLINDVEMLELASQSNSFGGGGSISLGSHRVCTINTIRLAIEADLLPDYQLNLLTRVEECAKILAAHKALIMDLKDKGLQQFISNGWINMKRMFSTIGIIGLKETANILTEKFGDLGIDYIENTLKLVNDCKNEMAKKYGLIMNIEQIPGESYAKRLPKADKLVCGDKAPDVTLYSNQFVPLWENATIDEKLKQDGKYNAMIDGGGIVHAQIGEKLTPTQALNNIMKAVKYGCEHFAFNAVYTKFEDNTKMFGKLETHPKTGAKAVDYFTRVVGFMTPVSSWNKERREWEFPRRTFIKL